jgi:hypothetical protein
MPDIYIGSEDVPPTPSTGAQTEIVFLAVPRAKGGRVEQPGRRQAVMPQIETEAHSSRQLDGEPRVDPGGEAVERGGFGLG